MNCLLRNLTTQLVRSQRLMLINTNRFATDAKKIQELVSKNKVVVFMKVS
jgi:hypothetical protein